MPKIRDLGINAIPEMTRPLEIGAGGGLAAACPDPTTIPEPPPPCPDPTTRPGEPPPPCPDPTTRPGGGGGPRISFASAAQLREELRKHL